MWGRLPFSKRIFLAVAVLMAPAAWGQHGPPPGGGPPMGGSMPNRSGAPGFPNPSGGPPPGNAPDGAGGISTMRGGLQLAPPGRWWNDRGFAKSLKLRPEQQRKMDAIFDENRSNLLQHYEAYQREQDRLEALTRARVLDEDALVAEIERVGQARIELEKVNTHMLLESQHGP